MECTQPPALTEDQLTAALDGEAASEVLQHLERCPGCSGRLQRAGQLESALRAGLWRWECPSPQALGDYHLQLLHTDQRAAVARHLDTCPHCAAELADLRAFLAAGPAPAARPRPFRLPRLPRPGELVAALVPQTPVMALRGSSAGQVTARASGIAIFLEFQPAASGFELTGQIIAEKKQDEWVGALAELRQADALICTATLDEFSEFKCALPTAEPATLRIRAHTGRVVVLDGLDLQGLSPQE